MLRGAKAAGQWRDVLTPAQIDRIVQDHAEEMGRFGYWPTMGDCHFERAHHHEYLIRAVPV